MAIRGGRRANAGRSAAYSGKTHLTWVDFTADGRRQLTDLVARHGLSRSDILNHLAREHAQALMTRRAFLTDDVVFPHKVGRAGSSWTIRLDDAALAACDRVRTRTGKSHSDIGEALVTWYGSTAQYPQKRVRHLKPFKNKRNSVQGRSA